MKNFNQVLQENLDAKKKANHLRILSSAKGIDFTSNDYIGLAHSPTLRSNIELALKEVGSFQNGSGGSRLLSGNTNFVESLENWIAKFHYAEAGLIFNSGYDANIGLFSCIANRHDIIFYDEFAHASIIDGIRLSFAKSYKFRHNDIEHLEQKLREIKGQNIFIAVESIYSMDGDFAPLKSIIKLAKQYNANVIVDEAHATGIIGESGRGYANELNIEKDCFARIHTFGKALGVHGAIVLGSEILRQYLINTSRSFIYTTALPFHSLLSIQCAYREMEQAKDERTQLNTLIHYFQSKLSQFKSIQGLQSSSAIQGIILLGNDYVKKIALTLQQQGLDIRPILSPTVPVGKERLRICLHSFNTTEQINLIFNTIHQSL